MVSVPGVFVVARAGVFEAPVSFQGVSGISHENIQASRRFHPVSL